jgi:uncharacterized protein involved in outer membrane biogenesis
MRWKWILSIVVVLIVALMVTVYAILSSYNFNNLKPKIAQAVKNTTGRELMLGGNIELQISLTPALVVEDVNFQNAPWGSRSELAKIRRLEVQVAVLPLISGIIEVKRLILVEPDILIETNRSGKSNLEFETEEKLAPAEPKEEAASEDEVTLSALIFNEVRIEKGNLTYKDGQSGQTYVIALESLLAIAATDGPVGLECKGSYNKRFCHLEATFGPLAAMTDPDIVWPVEITARAVGTTVTINGAIKDPLNGKGLDLTVNAKGQSASDLVKVFDVTDVPEVGPFKITGKLTDPGGRLTVKNLDLLVGTEELATVKLTGAVEDLQALQGIELDFAIQGKDLKNLEKIADQSLPLKGPFNASGHAVCSEAKNYKFSDLNLSFGESDLSGSAEINLTNEQPQITAVLSSRKLDLRPILLKEKEGETGSSEVQSSEAQAKQGKVFPNEPLPLDGLKQADSSVKIQAENMLLPGLALDDAAAHLVLQGGRLTVKPLRFAVGGGTTDGYLAMRPQGKATAVAMGLKIDHLDLGLMLNKLGINNVIEGQLDVDIDLEGEGSSVAGLMAGLSGKTVLVMSNGSIDNKLINLLGADLSSSLFRLLNPFEREAKRTELNCIVGGLDIKDGLAQTTALVLDTTQVSVVGHGKVNLKTEELDLSLKPSPKKGIGVKGIGKLSLSLAELTKSLKLTGTLANPSVTIDATGTFLAIGKAVGGLTLFGPVGVAAALASGKFGDKDLCLTAIEAAKNGGTASGNKKPEEKNGVVKETTGAVGNGVKELFSK